MHEVSDEIFYHINTGKKLKIGDNFQVGNDYNILYEKVYNTEHLLKEKDANMYLIDMRKKQNLLLDKDIAILVSNTISDDAMITRELMFEEERKIINPKLPSRLKSLYVCKTIKESKKWLDIFDSANKDKYQLLKLKLTGTIFKGDASFVLRQNVSLNKKKEIARRYWNGETENKINEYLFMGNVVVEDILNEKDLGE